MTDLPQPTLSAFDIIGPPMIGPSSSHTAGAVRIGLAARSLLDGPPVTAKILLHGSFAATGRGHATDRALVAGLLGYRPDDERLEQSLALAAASGLQFDLQTTDLGDSAHPNSACIELSDVLGETHRIIAASIGGGSIVITSVDRYSTSFGGDFETLLLWHADRTGFLAKVTAVLACAEANIAAIRTSRHGRGDEALAVIEVDAPLEDDCVHLIRRIPEVAILRRLARLP